MLNCDIDSFSIKSQKKYTIIIEVQKIIKGKPSICDVDESLDCESIPEMRGGENCPFTETKN